MIINTNDIAAIDMGFLREFFLDRYNQHYLRPSARIVEPYQLLYYLSHFFNDETLIDAGTDRGLSAFVLGANKKNRVMTYDTNVKPLPFLTAYPNIVFKHMDVNKEYKAVLYLAPLISLDIDPHDGKQERVFINTLEEIDYQGVVVCDDINLNDGMKRWWKALNHTKYDLTPWGHCSGTGIIDFSKKVQII